MLGFQLDLWDYLTFLTLALCGVGLVAAWVWMAGLPGRIAVARKHPDAEAVKLLGWAGLLPTIYPWVQAFIWAYKPTEIVDIRRFPQAEAQAIDADIARLGGTPPPATAPAPAAAPRARPPAPGAGKHPGEPGPPPPEPPPSPGPKA